MRAVLHFGMNKTGSTSIQNTLAAAGEALLDAGVLYPRLLRQAQHKSLLFAITDDAEFRTTSNRHLAEGIVRSREAADAAWESLREQVADARAHTLVLSSEYILGLRPRSVERLVARLAAFCEQIEFVGYVRSPTSHYVSGLQQHLKFGHEIRSPLQKRHHRRAIRKLQKVPGARLRMRPFARSALQEGCVCRDFMTHFLGLDAAQVGRIAVLRINESISAEGMAVLRPINAFAFPGVRRPGNALSRALLALIRAEELARPYTKPTLKPTIRHIIEHANRRDGEWLRDAAGIVFEDFAIRHRLGRAETALVNDPAWLARLDVPDLLEVDAARLEQMWDAIARALLRETLGLAAEEAEPAAPAAEPTPPRSAEGKALFAALATEMDGEDEGPRRHLARLIAAEERRRGAAGPASATPAPAGPAAEPCDPGRLSALRLAIVQRLVARLATRIRVTVGADEVDNEEFEAEDADTEAGGEMAELEAEAAD